MALKFRRGTTAQKSGSLAFGEPYVNTTLGTLQIGLETGDVTLLISSASQGISGSSLDITGNAKIDGNLTLGGNITIGDATTDTIVINADLSSSIIPDITNTFDVGSPSKKYKVVYANNVSASFIVIESGSWAELRLRNTDTGIAYHIQNTAGGNFSIHNELLNASVFRVDSGSTLAQSHVHIFSDLYVTTGSVFIGTEVSAATGSFGFIRSTNTISGSITGIGNVTAYSTSVDSRLSNLQTNSASVNSRLTVLESETLNLELFTSSINTTIKNRLNVETVISGSSQVLGILSSLNSYTASNDTTNTTQNSRLSRLEESTASLNSFTSSINTTIKNRLDAETVISGSSQVTLSATTGFTSYSSSVDSRILTEKGRVDAILLAADADKDSFAEIVTLINSIDTTNDNAFASFYTASVNRLNNLESTSASLAIETANLESFTSSINTTIKNKLNTDGVISGSSQVNFTQLSGISNGIVSGSSQVTPLLPTGTISGSAQLTSSYDGRYELQGRSVVSGSSQIDATATTNWATGIKTQLNSNTVVSGSSQVIGILSSLNSYTASNDTTNTTQNSRLDQLSTASGSAISRLNTLESETLNLELFTSSINTTIKSKLDADGVISSSVQLTSSLVQVSQTSSMTVLAANTVAVASTVTTTDSTLYPTFTNNIVNATVQLKSHPSGTFYFDGVTRKVYGEAFVGAIEATNGIVSGSSQITAGSTTNFATDVKTELNSNTVVSGSSQVNFTQLSGISANIISASSDTSNVDMIISGGSISANLYGGVVSGSAQVVGMLASLNAYTASNDTTNTNQSNKLSRLEESTASLNAYTASNDTKWSTLGSLSGSFARTNSANVFTGNQTITGSLFITQDLIVGGSSSIQNITSSNLVIGAAYVTLNTNTPSSRFAGLQIVDSGSAGSSGSFLYDAIQDEFIFVHKGNGLNVTSSHFILGPETYDNLGNESYLTNNKLPKGSGKEHLNDSNITDTGTLITLGSNSVVNGTFYATGTTLVSGSAQIAFSGVTGTVSNAQLANSAITIAGQSTSLGGSVTADTIRVAIGTIVTGSSQISHDSTTGYSANRHIDHTAVSITAGSGLTGGGDISATRTISIATGGVTDSMLAGSISNSKLTNNSITIAGQSTALGSSVTAETIRTAIGTVVTGSAQIDLTATTNYATGILTRLNTVGVFSGSSQVSHDSTTGYSANRHVDHTAVSITAGSGLTGGGDISTTRTISIANLGVTDAMLAGSISNAKLSNSAITIAGQSTSLGSSVTAETIRTAIGTVVTGSAQIAIASTSGFGTYINQAVLTTSSPTFAGLTINGSITATGDITAYYTSDKRHKNNIQIIPNALQKVSKLNGVTWEWNDDVNEVTKATPKTGLIAQDVQEVLPEVVREREDGFLSLDYSKMVGLLVEAIKEQQSQIHNLTLQVENLKKQKGL